MSDPKARGVVHVPETLPPYTVANDYGDMTCPVCAHEWQNDEPMDPEEGDEVECPSCGATLTIEDVETVPTFSLAAKGAPAAPGSVAP